MVIEDQAKINEDSDDNEKENKMKKMKLSYGKDERASKSRELALEIISRIKRKPLKKIKKKGNLRFPQ